MKCPHADHAEFDPLPRICLEEQWISISSPVNLRSHMGETKDNAAQGPGQSQGAGVTCSVHPPTPQSPCLHMWPLSAACASARAVKGPQEAPLASVQTGMLSREGVTCLCRQQANGPLPQDPCSS